MSLNVVVLVGRLVADPSLRYTSSGKAVANMRLAVDRGFSSANGEREADFLDVVCWEKLAENVTNNLQKGRLVGVQGRIQSRSSENQQGQRRDKVEVVASQVQFLDRGKRQDSDAGADHGDAGSGSFPMDDDEVPFLP